MPGRPRRAATQPRWVAALLVVAALAMGAVGCGGGSSTTTSSASGSAAAPENVKIKGYAYDPNPVTVPVGTTVTWTNADPTEHTATASDGSFDTGTIKGNGATAKVTLDKPGTYDYICQFHQFMKGQVIVQG
jgi:plastocyanin